MPAPVSRLTWQQEERYQEIFNDAEYIGEGVKAVVIAARADLLAELETFVLEHYSSDEPANSEYLDVPDDTIGLMTDKNYGESFCYHLRRFAEGSPEVTS